MREIRQKFLLQISEKENTNNLRKEKERERERKSFHKNFLFFIRNCFHSIFLRKRNDFKRNRKNLKIPVKISFCTQQFFTKGKFSGYMILINGYFIFSFIKSSSLFTQQQQKSFFVRKSRVAESIQKGLILRLRKQIGN